jgi:TonB family protein
VKIAFVVLGLLAGSAGTADEKSPAKTDDEVWALAERVNTLATYETYWNRFRHGAHTQQAVERFYALQGRPVLVAPPPPPIPVVTPLPQSSVDACTVLTFGQELRSTKSGEAQALFEAERSNRVSDYRAYLAKFPQGVCRERAQTRIEMRERLKSRYSPIAGFGPLVAQAKTRAIFTEDDYPVLALKNNEQGRVTAEWEVAEDGIAESCRVTKSSGSATLDDATCRIIMRRIRYDPARDANGVPVRSTDKMTTVWALPEEAPPAPTAKQ